MKNVKIIIDSIMPDDYSESQLMREISAVINQFGGEVCFSSQYETEDNIEKFNKYEKSYQDIIVDLGMKMMCLIEHYAITEEELVEFSKDVAEYFTYTRNRKIRDLLFDGDRPRYIKEGKVI